MNPPLQGNKPENFGGTHKTSGQSEVFRKSALWYSKRWSYSYKIESEDKLVFSFKVYPLNHKL